MSFRKSDQFLVIAYDIVNNRRRNRLVKLLKGYGVRANYSVFECRVKKKKIEPIKAKISKIINPKEDSVLYYHLCVNCVGRRDETGFREKGKQKKDHIII